MKGSIIERGDSYRLKVSLGKNPTTGKYESYYETVTGSKPQAQKRLRELLTQLDKGIFVKPVKSNLGEYLKTWLVDYCQPSLAPRTVELYSYLCRVHIVPALGAMPLSALKPGDLQHLYAEKLASGLSPTTVEKIHVVLHKSLKNAVKAGLLIRNVADSVDKPQIHRKDMRTMNENDIDTFLEAAKAGPYYALFFTYLFTGMRRSEALALRWSDLDLLDMQLSVSRSIQVLKGEITFREPKTQSSRRLISLSPATCLVLREHRAAQEELRTSLQLAPLADNDPVFSRYDGKPMLPDGIGHAWAKLARKVGLRGIRLHDARHTMATLMLKQGVHPKVVQERLGHANISTTLDTYSHVSPGLQQAAANGFDSILKKDADREIKELFLKK